MPDDTLASRGRSATVDGKAVGSIFLLNTADPKTGEALAGYGRLAPCALPPLLPRMRDATEGMPRRNGLRLPTEHGGPVLVEPNF